MMRAEGEEPAPSVANVKQELPPRSIKVRGVAHEPPVK